MPHFTYKDVIKRLKKVGFEFYRQGKGSHELWVQPSTGKKVLLPKHQHGLSTGTALDIAKKAGFKNLTDFERFK